MVYLRTTIVVFLLVLGSSCASKKDLNKTNSQIDQTIDRLESLQRDRVQLVKNLEALGSEEDASGIEINRLKSQLNDLEHKQADYITDLEQLRKQGDTTERQVVRINGFIADYQEKQSEIREILSELNKKWKELDN